MNEIVIGTRLNNSQLNKDLIKLEKELDRFVQKEERLLTQKQKLDIDISKGYNNLQTLDDKLNIINQKIKNMEEANLPANLVTNIDYQKLINQRDQLNRKAEEYLQKMDAEKGKLTDINTKLSNNRKEQTRLNNEIGKMAHKLNLPSVSLDGINKALKGIVNKVIRWGLAVFGVRTAYNAIRGAMNIISQYDDNLNTNIKYIQFALANTIKSLIEWIIKAVYQILGFVGKIIFLLTGKNIFKNSGIDDFQKAMASSSKDAKDIKKSLASFDEMNVLQDNSSSTGGGTGVTLPEDALDLSQINNYETGIEKVTDSLTQKWIDLGEDMRKSLDDPKVYDEAFGNWSMFIKGCVEVGLGLWDIITGIIEVIGGLMDIIVGLFTGDLDKIKEGWDWLVKGLLDIVIGLIETIVGLLHMIFGVIIGIALDIWDGIKQLCSIVGEWIYDHVIKPVGDFFSGLWDGIKEGVGNAVQWVKDKFYSIVDFFSNLISKIVRLFKNIGTRVGEVVGGAFKVVINGVLKAIENILNFPIKAINKLITTINKVPGINLNKLDTFNLPRLARGGIVNNPGRGVPVGGAIAGEAGREAVLPITDPSIMAMIGESIGKYVNINATVPVYVGNRQIAREIKKINTNNDFAYNR